MNRFWESPGLDIAENDRRTANREPALPGRQRLRLPGSTIATPLGTRDSRTESVDWLRAWRTIQKHWRLSTTFAVSVMITVVLVTVLTKPTYAPEARVEIDPPGDELFNMDARERTDIGPDYLETQARNMQGDELLVSVMRQMQLDRLPEFTQKGLLKRSIGAISTAMEKIPVWLWGAKKEEMPAPSNAGLLILTSGEASTLRAMHKQLSVNRDTASRLVTVSFASHDPVLAATVTNTIVRSFIDRSYQTRHDAIIRSTEWLERQLDDIRGKMEASNRALAAFQGASGIADVDQYRSTFTEQLAELFRDKTQTLSSRIEMQSFLSQVRNGHFENLPQVQGNQVVQALTQRLSEVRAELSQTLAVYGKNHPNAQRLQNQAEELESQITLQQKAIVGEMETRYAAALSREELINNQLRATSRETSQMAQYTALKKEAQTNADLYNALYSRVKEAGITAASKSINIRVVDQARVLDTPTRPQPLINLGLGFCVALIGGVFLALIREAFDHRIHTIQDVRQSIGISAVSILPTAEGNVRSTLGSFGSLFGAGHERRILNGPTNFLLDDPGSEQSEAFRGIYTSVMLSQPGRPPRVLLVGSSIPGEGKTTVAINLAVALVQRGRTCILDADLRRPSVDRAFGITTSTGLGDYLGLSASLPSILKSVPHIERLTVIAAGKAVRDPGKLMNLDNMKVLIRDLREMYDFVVIDSPPILPYSEGRALAPFVDGIVFVSRAGVVTQEAMARSMELLEEVHSAPILEVVLNGANAQDNSYGYSYGYGDYSSRS